ncbi:hypothetical protein PG990_000887 [Apiospora arundinis]|uniref:Uncharacterized protein n=1 Tax=Apiospora arundinis TaxID=335852 RepID=A0ABR2I0M0_9PEZI
MATKASLSLPSLPGSSTRAAQRRLSRRISNAVAIVDAGLSGGGYINYKSMEDYTLVNGLMFNLYELLPQ